VTKEVRYSREILPVRLSTRKRTSKSMTFNQRNHRILGDPRSEGSQGACRGFDWRDSHKVSNVRIEALNSGGLVDVGEGGQVGGEEQVVEKL
jgi:hypothetical protein